MTVSRIVIMLRIAIGLIFLVAAIGKLNDPAKFLSAVYGYELVGPKTGLLTAITLPALEAVIGALLVTGTWRFSASLAATTLAVLFVVTQAMAISNGVRADCGCVALFGPSALSQATLGRAVLLLSVCVSLVLLEWRAELNASRS